MAILLPASELATGDPDNTKFVRGDRVWAAPIGVSDTTPAAPSGSLNVKWQEAGGVRSAYVDVAILETLIALADLAGNLPVSKLAGGSGASASTFWRGDGTWAASDTGETTFMSFYAYYDRIVPAANKYMATLFNTSATRKAVLQRIYRKHEQAAAVTGVVLEQELVRITARTAGSGVTIRSEDTADTLSPGITADTNSTAVTESHVIMRPPAASEEAAVPQAQLSVWDLQGAQLIYERKTGTRGLTLRQNEGISIQNLTPSTVGSVSYWIEITDEAA